MSHAPQNWQRPEDLESTWVDDVIENQPQPQYTIQKLVDAQLEGLRQTLGDSEIRKLSAYEQITPENANRGQGTLARYLALKHADPVRTDVLRFMIIESTVKWLKQHYPPERIASMETSGYGPESRANVVGIDLKIDVEANRRCLYALHPGQKMKIDNLLATIKHEELEALRRIIGWRLGEPPTPWIKPKTW